MEYGRICKKKYLTYVCGSDRNIRPSVTRPRARYSRLYQLPGLIPFLAYYMSIIFGTEIMETDIFITHFFLIVSYEQTTSFITEK
jgi:hypothetical protein